MIIDRLLAFAGASAADKSSAIAVCKVARDENRLQINMVALVLQHDMFRN